MLSRALKMAFWVSFDHLGKLILVSLLWAFAMAIPGFFAASALYSGIPAAQLAIGLPALAVAFGVVGPVFTAGIVHLAKVLIETRDGAARDAFRGMALYWGRAVGLGALFVAVAICLATSVWFYAATFKNSVPWLGYGLSALAAWLLLFEGLMSLAALPALVQKKGSLRETLKLSALLVLDNPLFFVGLAVQVAAFTALALLVTPVLFFLYGGVVGVMVTSAYEMLSRKYAAREQAVDSAHAAALRARGMSAARSGVPDDEDDDYLNRGVRDLLFPWKG